MRIRTLYGVALLSIVTLGLVACGGADPTPTPTATTPPAAATPTPTPTTPSGTDTPTACSSGAEEVQVIHGESPYKFQPETLEFELGKPYCLTFNTPVTEFHTFNVDDLNLSLYVNPGETLQVDFTPEAPGTFKLYCIPHESQGMTGQVIVR